MVFPLDLRLAVATTLVAAVSGCGGGSDRPDMHPVSGVVLHDGKPVTDAVVVFSPEKGQSATGRTDAEGRFTLGTFESSDGAAEGTYKVTIVPATDPSESGPTSAEDYDVPTPETDTSGIPQKYRNAQTSDLTVKVPADTEGELKLELKE